MDGGLKRALLVHSDNFFQYVLARRLMLKTKLNVELSDWEKSQLDAAPQTHAPFDYSDFNKAPIYQQFYNKKYELIK